MDFPSREEARVYARLQAESGSVRDPAPPSGPLSSEGLPAGDPSVEATRFRIVKPGFEQDIYDRRGIRNLLRTGEIFENDRLRVDDGEPVDAGKLPYLKSLFDLRKTSTAKPPQCCRTHTDKVAFFQCQDTRRPLCEDCAQEKKFGGTTLRVCEHCGGTAINHAENASA